VAAGIQGIGKGKTSIANMQKAGRAGREAKFHDTGLCLENSQNASGNRAFSSRMCPPVRDV
jgi:hypothetical protein